MDHLTPQPHLFKVPFQTKKFQGMPYRRLGESGLQAPNIGLGTWKFGLPETGDGARVDENTAMDIFDASLELGTVFWDTANRYNEASGNSERVIGRWLHANSEQRRNIVLASKCMGGMDGTTPNHSGLSRGNILDSVYASLQRLQTDYLDLLYFHRPDDDIHIEESLLAVEDLIRQDLVRYFAVSNFTVEQLEAYQQTIKSLSPRCRIVAVQNKYDLLSGEDAQQQGVLQYCADHGISFIPWSPLGRGLLTGRYLASRQTGPGDRLIDEGESSKELKQSSNQLLLERLDQLARQWEMQLTQLVLAYMLKMKGMGPIIAAVSSRAQLEANAAAGKMDLSNEQIEAVQQALASG